MLRLRWSDWIYFDSLELNLHIAELADRWQRHDSCIVARQRCCEVVNIDVGHPRVRSSSHVVLVLTSG